MSPIQRLFTDLEAGLGSVQSPYLYIQAAGSDETDGSVAGVHLRWDLLKELGENHIPKGDLAAGPGAVFPAPYGFNRPDDYVTILRLPYNRRYPCSINLEFQKPVERVETGATRSWKFQVAVEGRTPAVQRQVVFRFTDVAKYDQTLSTLPQNSLLSRFVGAYPGVIEVEVLGELCFGFYYQLPASLLRGDIDQMRVEAVSADANEPASELLISCRKKFLRQASASVRAENVRYFRFASLMYSINLIQLETYSDFLAGTIENKSPVISLGNQFALSLDDQTVSARLRGGSPSKIDGRWPRFVGADPSTGRRFTMNAGNYGAKWGATVNDGLKAGVVDYLSLSESPGNPTGIASLPSEQPGDHSAFEMSYLKMLKLVGLDYHVARMLGLGCIDEEVVAEESFIYAAVYRTSANLESNGPPKLLAPAFKQMQPGETAPLTIGLSKAAPPGGVYVTVAGGGAVAAASPVTTFVPSGKTIATILVSASAGGGSVTLSMSAPGYGSAATQVQVAVRPQVLLGGSTVIPLGEEQPFEVRLSAAAGTGQGAEGPSPFERTHVYLTLPTSRQHDRRPPAPVQLAPTFGISLDNGTSTPTQLTDENGYAPCDDEGARIINLNLEPFETMRQFGPFFDPPTEFCSSDTTKPVFYGCKYKLESEQGYRVPEPSSDKDFQDGNGVLEVVPLIPQRTNVQIGRPAPIFSHTERQNGLHEYALYGINWFSRSSPLSNTVEVDTLIPKQNRLLPPSNLAVQLIQREDSLLLTTKNEQDLLTGLPGDKTLIRCTFEWDQNHYHPQKLSNTNQYADEVEFYFRQEPPRAVQGQIKSVTNLPNEFVEVRTQSYSITSVSPVKTITPAILQGDEDRFKGSAFAANQVVYTVESVAQSAVNGEGPVFRLKKNLGTTLNDFGNNNQYATQLNVAAPSAGERFLVVENMSATANWNSTSLAKKISLKTFLTSGQLHRETVDYPDGSQKVFPTGGIYETARISVPADPADPNPILGVYEITFDSFQLPHHPDADVEWYRGTVTVPEEGSDIKPVLRPLQVYGIVGSGSTLKLIAYDASVGSPGYKPPKTATNVNVNFHPGYRFYLTAQAGILDEVTTLPGPAQSTQETILAVRAKNSALGIESNLTQPVVIQGRKLIDPIEPEEPVGPRYATRPNFYGKSTWTMDVTTKAQEPYGFVFYRANERSVLDVLYTPKTVATILTNLASLSEADRAFESRRWKDLVNAKTKDDEFLQYIPNGFRFPNPDNNDYLIPETVGQNAVTPDKPFEVKAKPGLIIDKVKNAINGVFLPLTESPVIYQFIKPGTQTSSAKPVIRDTNGDLLPFASSSPSPMAVKYDGQDGKPIVRFTDYTLDGAAKNIYFYYAVEMNDRMKMGQRSGIAGPIRLVNTLPPEAPTIRTVITILEDPAVGTSTGVRVAVNNYITAEGITGFRLYRAITEVDAVSTRTMKVVGLYPPAEGPETALVDEFADLDYPPFGESILYRVVAVRKITNERDEEELIPSLPSAAVKASVVDTQNPIAPSIKFESDPPTLSFPIQLPNVRLSWRRAGYNASYRLYKQGSTGNWTKIHEQKSNAQTMSVALGATEFGSSTLRKHNEDGRAIYHRFKVEVENASGMFSLNEPVLTVPATCRDGATSLGSVLSVSDSVQAPSPLTDRIVDASVVTFPGSLTFRDITATMPIGHLFDRIQITLNDSLGHSAQKTIALRGGSAVFAHGDGAGVVLDGSELNVSYTVRAKVMTDSCQDGMQFSYRLRYGPETKLLDLLEVLSLTDAQNTLSALAASVQAPSGEFPGTMSFSDITVLPAGHRFEKLEVRVRDEVGGSFVKFIDTAKGTVAFNHGQGGLVLDGSRLNQTYRITAKLFTNLSPNGVEYAYSVSY